MHVFFVFFVQVIGYVITQGHVIHKLVTRSAYTEHGIVRRRFYY